MLKQHFEKQFAYNRWAWGEVFKSVAQLDDAVYKQDMSFFWESIHGMLVHALFAEHVWRERSMGNSLVSRFDPDDYVDFAAVRTRWLLEMDAFDQFITVLDEAEIKRPVTYTNISGTSFTLDQAYILQHVITHSMEHRSQLTPVLHKQGVPTQALDFIYYCYR